MLNIIYCVVVSTTADKIFSKVMTSRQVDKNQEMFMPTLYPKVIVRRRDGCVSIRLFRRYVSVWTLDGP